MKQIIFLAMIYGFALDSYGGEVEDYCNLVKAQAGARADTLIWPSLTASFGNPFFTSNVIAAVGVDQSLSGFIRGLLTSDTAYYQCHSYAANKVLRDNVMFLDDRISLLQAEAQLPLIKEALILSEENLNIEQELLDTQNATILDLTEALTRQDEIQTLLAALEQRASSLREIPKGERNPNLKVQAELAVAYDAKASSLNSMIEALSAWDVRGSGGIRYDVPSRTASGFWSVNLTYSFGQVPSTLKAASVSRFAREFGESRFDSVQNTYRRATRSLPAILASERSSHKSIVKRLEIVQVLLEKAKSASSIRAKRAQRNLHIQELQQKAALAASTVKIEEIENWIRDSSGEPADRD